jgi:hypothetical protein
MATKRQKGQSLRVALTNTSFEKFVQDVFLAA